MNISEKFDSVLKIELEKKLKRPASVGEITNADNDSDLVNETLWQLVVELDKRVSTLEESNKKL